jgi:hypothetical protein
MTATMDTESADMGAHLYLVFIMVKADVDVFRVDKTFMVNGMLTE